MNKYIGIILFPQIISFEPNSLTLSISNYIFHLTFPSIILGRILLPVEYPFKPPNIIFLTPSGRFETNTKICLSFSAYHPELWQPAWGIRLILEALISFLPTDGDGAIGALNYTSDERKKLAKRSLNFACPCCGNCVDIMKGHEERVVSRGKVGTNGDGGDKFRKEIEKLHALQVKTEGERKETKNTKGEEEKEKGEEEKEKEDVITNCGCDLDVNTNGNNDKSDDGKEGKDKNTDHIISTKNKSILPPESTATITTTPITHKPSDEVLPPISPLQSSFPCPSPRRLSFHVGETGGDDSSLTPPTTPILSNISDKSPLVPPTSSMAQSTPKENDTITTASTTETTPTQNENGGSGMIDAFIKRNPWVNNDSVLNMSIIFFSMNCWMIYGYLMWTVEKMKIIDEALLKSNMTGE